MDTIISKIKEIIGNERIIKSISLGIAAVWVVSIVMTVLKLQPSLAGNLFILCHILAPLIGYHLASLMNKSKFGWAFAVFFCPAVVILLLREHKDTPARIEAVLVSVFWIAGIIYLKFFPGDVSPLRSSLAFALWASYAFIVVYAVRLADAAYRSKPGWGIGCGLFPPLLLFLAVDKIDLDTFPGGKVIRAVGRILFILFFPVIWLFSAIGKVLSSVWSWVEDKFPSLHTGYSAKSCSACGRSVSASASAGGRCPYCGAYWSYERQR